MRLAPVFQSEETGPKDSGPKLGIYPSDQFQSLTIETSPVPLPPDCPPVEFPTSQKSDPNPTLVGVPHAVFPIVPKRVQSYTKEEISDEM